MLRRFVALGTCWLASSASAEDSAGAALKASDFFDGFMRGLGTPVSSSMLAFALSPKCGLHFDQAHEKIKSGLALTMGPSSEAVLQGVQALARVLQIFSQAHFRCHLITAGDVAELASALLELNQTDVSHGRFMINGVDVSSTIHQASVTFAGRNHRQAGLQFAQAFVLASSGEDGDDEPMGRETWSTMDAHGRIRGENELQEHWRDRKRRRLQALEVQAKQPDSSIQPDGTSKEEARDPCCCCWTQIADAQIATTHAAHVY